MTAMSRPAVRVNQLGYLPGAPQQATLVTDATAPLEFIPKTAISLLSDARKMRTETGRQRS